MPYSSAVQRTLNMMAGVRDPNLPEEDQPWLNQPSSADWDAAQQPSTPADWSQPVQAPAPEPAYDYQIADGRTAPPTPGGNWEPWQVTPTPAAPQQTASVPDMQVLAEDSVSRPVEVATDYPLTPPPSPYAAGQAESMVPRADRFDPAPPTYGQVQSAGYGEPDYVDSRPRTVTETVGRFIRDQRGPGGLLEPMGGGARITARMLEIQQQANREMGRSAIGESAVADPEWQARNPALYDEYAQLQSQFDLSMLGNMDAPRRVGQRAVQAAAPVVREAAEGAASRVRGLVDDAADVLYHGSSRGPITAFETLRKPGGSPNPEGPGIFARPDLETAERYAGGYMTEGNDPHIIAIAKPDRPFIDFNEPLGDNLPAVQQAYIEAAQRKLSSFGASSVASKVRQWTPDTALSRGVVGDMEVAAVTPDALTSLGYAGYRRADNYAILDPALARVIDAIPLNQFQGNREGIVERVARAWREGTETAARLNEGPQSVTAAGLGSVPGSGALPAVNRIASEGIAGGVGGAVVEQARNPDEDPRTAAARGFAAGAVGFPLATRAIRAAAGRGGARVTAGTLGNVPDEPVRRAPRSVEVLQDKIDHTKQVLADIDPRTEPELYAQVQDRLGRLTSEWLDARAARVALEPAISSDVGRQVTPLNQGAESAEMKIDAQFPRERVSTGDAANLGGPASVPVNMAGRQNAGVPFDPSGAALGAGAGGAAGDEGEFDPMRAAAGMAVGGILGRRIPRQPGKTFAFGARPGERLEFNVKVVPLNSLVTSHDDALRINRAFPQELQPRVRERAASGVQIDKIVNTFDPEQVLIDSHRIDSGPMIVGPDLVVESGNGRSIALRRLAKENPEAYQEYVEALRQELPRYGLTEDALKGIDQPVLVRERATPMTPEERARYTADANVGVQARMAPVEQAMQDAGRLSDDAVSRIVVGEDQTIDEALLSAENGAFRRAFMGTIPDTEWGELLDASGNLNPKGLARVKDALLAKTYQGSSGARLTTAFVDSLDSGIKNVQHGIMGSLPTVSRAEARIAAGEIDPSLSIANDMAVAADVYSRLRRRKSLLKDYLAQSGMFDGRETTPFQDKILAYLDENARSPKRIRALLDEYARTVDSMAGGEQVDMFGMAIPQATKEEVFDGVLRRLGADADQRANVGGIGAGGNVVEGAADGADAVPATAPNVAAAGEAGAEANAAGSGPRLTPEEQLARFQAAQGQSPATNAAPAPLRPANLGPVPENIAPRGGPEGALAVEGAPSTARPGPLPENVAPTGGPQGTLAVEGAPQPFVRPSAVPEGAAPAGGPEGRLMREGAPPESANLPPPSDLPATGGPEGALKSPPTYSDATLRMFQERIRDPERAEAAAREYQRLVDDGASPEAVAKFLKNAQDSRWWDRFDTLRYASMLSDPVTHGQNALGSVQLGVLDAVERPLTALLDAGRARVTGGPREAFLSQASAQLIGMAGSARQGLKDAAFIMAHGLRPEDLAKLDKRNRGFATNIPVLAPRGSTAANAVDFVAEGPLRALGAADALFRGTFRGGHLAAEAEGAARRANGGRRVTVEQVQKYLEDPDVAQVAEERAAQAVLQEDRAVTRAINSMRSKLPEPAQAALSVAVPYIKTPYNIVAQGVGMTPAGVISLIGDIRAGKPMADRERRVARMMIGAGVMAWASWENVQGVNTGGYPKSQAERSTLPPGWRPYSRKVEIGGETYYVPLALLGPIGIPAMLSILATEQYRQGGGFGTEQAVAFTEAVGQLAQDQTFLRSIADFNDAISKGGNTAVNYLERQVSQFSPHVIGGGGVGRRIQAIRGEPSRDPEGPLQAFLATLPYTADQVPARLDVIGRESVQNPDGLAALVPIRASREDDAAVIRAFRQAKVGLPMTAPRAINDPDTGGPRQLTQDQRNRWQRVFGQEIRQRWSDTGGTTDSLELERARAAAREAANATVLGRR